MEIPKTMTEQLMEAVEKVSRNDLRSLIASTSALEQLRTEFNRIQDEQNRMKPKATHFELAMEKLKQDVVKMPVGFEFEIPQVIGADIWSKLERGSKLALGKHVKASQDAYGLEFLRTSTSRHAIYRRAE